MDLLGDLGTNDQLTSTREENKILQKKIEELKLTNRELTIENEALKAEVDVYRREALSLATGLNGLSMKDDDQKMDDTESAMEEDTFVKSGDGVFPTMVCATLKNVHGISNPLCGALHFNDYLLGTGGADGELVLTQWGLATAPYESAASDAVQKALRVRCDGPVLKLAFATKGSGISSIVAAGCMDGSIALVQYTNTDARKLKIISAGSSGGSNIHNCPMKHSKYVKEVVWSPSGPFLVSACAEGKVYVTKIGTPDDSGLVIVERIQTLHLSGAVEALCFIKSGEYLCCYARGTSYISYFDVKNDWKQTKHSVNGANCFDDFVSFTILSLIPSPDGKYLAAATDASRNIIFEACTPIIVRDLYGKNTFVIFIFCCHILHIFLLLFDEL